LLLKHGEGPVRTQLAVAMASLAAHLPATEWDGIGALQWLATRMSGDGTDPSPLSCLLELLVVFPQEAGSYRPAVHPERRRNFARELILESKSAITIITSCLENVSAKTRKTCERALDAYAAWVRLSQGRLYAVDQPLQAPQIDAATLCAHPLTLLTLQSLTTHDSSPSQFDHAVDATCELIRATTSKADDSGDNDRQNSVPTSSLQLVQVIVSSVLALKPTLIAASQSDGSLDEIAKGISRLLAEIGEEYVTIIAEVRLAA
jgi:transportin-3|tara:strand:- start:15211 stop:15996 length:786 start_codon:yes stop_codon:yes gene_type:complete